MLHTAFTTARRRLNRSSFAYRLYEKAKRYGVWNPDDIDFTQDRMDWAALSPDEQDVLLRLTAMFQAGEEAVTLDLLPLIQVIAAEGRLEEELFLTTFLADEAKHTDFFNRFLDEVTQIEIDLSAYHLPNYCAIFYEALPAALGRLRTDPSPKAQLQAAATYNLIVEGVLAETGYHAYFTVLEQRDILPGQRAGIAYLKQDESRHIAYGVQLIERLLAADPLLWSSFEETMNTLLAPALGVVQEVFDVYEVMPFGLSPADFSDYALQQFGARLDRIAAAAQRGG